MKNTITTTLALTTLVRKPSGHILDGHPILNLIIHRLILALVLLVCCAVSLVSQTELNDDGESHRIEATGTVEDFVIPAGNYNVIEFTLRGGDGGTASVSGVGCLAEGGDGATVKAKILIGTGSHQLPVGTPIRFIVGEKGECFDNPLSVGISGYTGGGGGGTAVLAYKDGSWEIIAVAGGGGGAYQGAILDLCVARQRGQGGRATTWGGSGEGEYGGNGGVNGQGGGGGGALGSGDLAGGGGGAFSDGIGNFSKEGEAGFPDGGDAGFGGFGRNGGWGFGGGGEGENAGGGGGGYSGGGGGGAENNGGGGGSYVHPTYAVDTEITAGGNTGDKKDGRITYQLKQFCSVEWADPDNFFNSGFEYIEPLCNETDRGTIQMLYNYNGGNICESEVEWTIFQSGGDTQNYVNEGNGRWSNVAVGFHLIQVVNKELGSVLASTQIQVRPQSNIPVAKCKDVTVTLAPIEIIPPSDFIDDGSYGSECDESISFSLSKDRFRCGDLGENTVVLTVTGSNGYSSTCQSTVTVVDPVPMEAKCKPMYDFDLRGRPSVTISVSDIDDNSILSDCLGEMRTFPSTATVTSDDVGKIREVYLFLESREGNIVSNCSTILRIVDSGAFNAACKENFTLPLDDAGQATLNPADIDNGSIVPPNWSLSVSQSEFDCLDIGNQEVSLILTDGGDNTSTCTSTVQVVDNIVPVALCQNASIKLDENGVASISASQIDNGSNDACGIDHLALDKTAFTCEDVGIQEITLTASDDQGNEGSCTATVTVEDDIAPVIAHCLDLTLQLSGESITFAHHKSQYFQAVSDNCGIASIDFIGSTTLTCADVGVNERGLEAIDDSGNRTTCSFNVTVVDEESPDASCQDITVALDAEGNASITPDQINDGSFDDCGIANLSLDKASFDCTNLDDNTITLTATDVHANSSTCTATVTIEDNIAPTALCQDITIQLSAAGSASVDIEDIDAGSYDNCGIELINLSVSDTYLCNRIGLNNVTLSMRDAHGNEASCQATVTVQDNIGPEALCQNVTVQLESDGTASITATDIDNGSNDACGIANLSLDKASFDCKNLGDNTVTLSATDVNNNRSTCTATVTVEDNTAPVASCQDLTIQLDENGEATIAATTIDNGSNDACGIATMSLDQTNFTCDQTGDNTVTLSVIDNSQNTGTCQATVTVLDEIAPTLSCQQHMTVNTYQGECGAYVLLPKAVASDNCGLTSLISRYRPIDENEDPIGEFSAWADDHSGFFETGSFEIQWKAGDGANTYSYCVMILDVIDQEAPKVTCKDVIINFNGEETIAIPTSSIFDETASFDACGAVSFVSQSLAEVSCEDVGETFTVQIVGVDPNGNTSTCDAQVTVIGIPCGFEATDISCPEGAGATYDPTEESYTLTAEDCEGYPDGEFSTVMTELCGDGEIIAKVASLIGDGRAGVIMMESNDPGARFVSKIKDLTPRTRTEYRTTTGGSISNKRKNRTGVKWVRIVRQGPKFKTYTSTNGSYWRHSHTIEYETFADCIRVGLITYSKNANEPVTAVFENVKVIGDTPSALEQITANTASDLQGIEAQQFQTDTRAEIDLNVAPNPFADQTQIAFTLPKAVDVTLEIYNLHGQRVQSLEAAQLDAGTHRYQWNGQSSKGESLPTGIYMLRLRADKKWITAKVSLINR